MKNSAIKILLVLLLSLFSQYTYGQTIGEWKTLLDNFCERHFEECFGWEYIDILSIDEIDIISQSKVNIEGKARNVGYFGVQYTREFKAEINIYPNSLKILFKKQNHTEIRGWYWTECERTIQK